MAGRKPSGSRFKRAFLIAAAVLGLGSTGVVLDHLPKNTATDTQTISTIGDHGINISPSDQLWKHTLSMKSQDQRNDEMVMAAMTGDSWRVQALFEHGVSPRSATAATALNEAAFFGNADVVQVMMKNGVDPTMGDSEALLQAVRGGRTDIALQLMNYGAQANAQNSEALVLTAMSGDEFMTAVLIGRGADATAQNSFALQVATTFGNTTTAEILANAGATLTPPPALTIDNSIFSTPDVTGYTLDGLSTDGFKPFSPWRYRPGPLGPF